MHFQKLHAFLFPLLIATGLTGTVVGIHDGDTLRLRTSTSTLKVRLFGIDAPELGQPFSRASREKLSTLTFGRKVQLITHGKDAYSRQLAEVVLEDGTNVNNEMVRAGMAYYFRRYTRSTVLESMENEARRERRGVWSVHGLIPPWEFRKRERAQ